VSAPEVLPREAVSQVEVVKLLILRFDLAQVRFHARDERFAIGNLVIGGFVVRADLIGRQKEAAKLLAVHRLKIVYRNLIPTLFADVFRAVAPYVHLRAAGAVCISGEEVLRLARWRLPTGLLAVQNGHTALPETFREDRFHLRVYPLLLRLEGPAFRTVVRAGVIGAMKALGRGVEQESPDGSVRERRTVTRAVPAFVENARYGAFALMSLKQLVEQHADGRLLGVRLQLLIVPAVSKGRCSADRFPKFGTDRNRRRNAVGDFFSFPLRHGGDHREEEPASRRTGVDRLLEGYEVSATLAKDFGKFE